MITWCEVPKRVFISPLLVTLTGVLTVIYVTSTQVYVAIKSDINIISLISLKYLFFTLPFLFFAGCIFLVVIHVEATDLSELTKFSKNLPFIMSHNLSFVILTGYFVKEQQNTFKIAKAVIKNVAILMLDLFEHLFMLLCYCIVKMNVNRYHDVIV